MLGEHTGEVIAEWLGAGDRQLRRRETERYDDALDTLQSPRTGMGDGSFLRQPLGISHSHGKPSNRTATQRRNRVRPEG